MLVVRTIYLNFVTAIYQVQTTTNTTADNKLTETDSLSNQVIHMYCMDLLM